jgi:hypothetical protein
VLMRPHEVASFASDHRPLVVAGMGIASLAVLIAAAFASALRRERL